VSRAGAEPDAATLIAHCREQLASYKKPKAVHFVKELPRNATGKVVKQDLRQRLEGDGLATQPL
jgi:fatty-acyl-CoA synthase